MVLQAYMKEFRSMGLVELWLQYGTGDKRRMEPIHEGYTMYGPVKLRAMLKAYFITGNDYLSKVGSKHVAVSCNPELFLSNFAETEVLTEAETVLAEHYSVKVWAGVRSTSTATTFDQLRLEQYVNGASLETLPPTSSVVRGHIHRSAYLIRDTLSLLKPDYHRPDPLENGWISQFGRLLPAKHLKPLPERILKICGCQKTREKKICQCKMFGNKCTIYCHGKVISQLCRNK